MYQGPFKDKTFKVKCVIAAPLASPNEIQDPPSSIKNRQSALKLKPLDEPIMLCSMENYNCNS